VLMGVPRHKPAVLRDTNSCRKAAPLSLSRPAANGLQRASPQSCPLCCSLPVPLLLRHAPRFCCCCCLRSLSPAPTRRAGRRTAASSHTVSSTLEPSSTEPDTMSFSGALDSSSALSSHCLCSMPSTSQNGESKPVPVGSVPSGGVGVHPVLPSSPAEPPVGFQVLERDGSP
jgi:hypothetical protein